MVRRYMFDNTHQKHNYSNIPILSHYLNHISPSMIGWSITTTTTNECHFLFRVICIMRMTLLIPLPIFVLVLGRRDGFVVWRAGSFLACGSVSESCSKSRRHRSPCLRLASAMSPPPSAPRQPRKARAHLLLSHLLSSFFVAPDWVLQGFVIQNRGGRPRVLWRGSF